MIDELLAALVAAGCALATPLPDPRQPAPQQVQVLVCPLADGERLPPGAWGLALRPPIQSRRL